MSGSCCDIEVKTQAEKKLLITLLSINATMFVLELTVGIISESTALIADSLDMFGDAMVYAVGLYAVGKSLETKAKAAYLNGILQIILGTSVLLDVMRRLVFGSEPDSLLMVVLGVVALTANLICFALLMKHRQGEIHLRSTWICTRNDVIANVGVLIAAGLVAVYHSPLPDLIIAFLIAGVVLYGGIQILREAKQSTKPSTSCCGSC
ncbi:cation transporter [Candidatus Albibeggiatoa sp. nov. NOAA]|uniref:cation transporter n=1 Tax=Candidatus Albibeggiatoa sp. nov. NOAA TaxID=3162724 RepID=UPI0032FF72E6|nr:cation transporter [Thiotrichaceae bacterium]